MRNNKNNNSYEINNHKMLPSSKIIKSSNTINIDRSMTLILHVALVTFVLIEVSFVGVVTGFQPSFHITTTTTTTKRLTGRLLKPTSSSSSSSSSSSTTPLSTRNFSTIRQSSKLNEQSNNDNEWDEFDESPPEAILDDRQFSENDLEGLTVAQLKQQLRLRSMKVSGKKSDLIKRLIGNRFEDDDDEEEEEGGNEIVDADFQRVEKASSTKKAQEFARSRGKEFIDISDFLDEEDKGKETKSSLPKEDESNENDDPEKINASKSPETWGDEAKIVDDFEGRSVIVDSLSRTIVEFKGSQSAKVQAYVVASRDSLTTYLAGGDRGNNAADLSTAVKNIQMTREKASKVPMKLEDQQGEDVDDEEGLYKNILDRDYGDFGDYSTTGAEYSAKEVKGVLLLSDVYGPLSEDTKMLAEKIAFECQPVVVFAPDLFRGKPWKEIDESGLNKNGETFEEWRTGHPEQRVSVDIRAAAAALREQYGVSSTCIFGQCFGGGRALEATARSYPNDTMDDVDGSIGPTHVNPSTCIAWYPTRYDASSLFGSDRKRTDDRNTSDVSIMAVFAENDTIPGATSNDAAKLKSCLEEDNRAKDHMVKVFPGQDHGFAHVGMSIPAPVEKDDFLDREFGNAPSYMMESCDAEVAFLLSTAWMETYSRVFLPTVGEAVKENESWSELLMPDLTDSRTRDIRNEVEEALEMNEDVEVDLNRMHPDNFNSAFDDIDPEALKAQPFGISLEDTPDTFLDKLEAAIDREDVDFLPGIGNVPLDESPDLGKAYW